MVYLIAGVLIVMAVAFLLFKMGAAAGALPILNYHRFSNGKGDFLYVNTGELRRQFRHLNKKGYTTIFLSELLEHIEQNKPLPARPVMITVDDGLRNNYSHLYPLLKEYNIKANIFLVAGFIQSQDNKHVMPNPMGEFMFAEEAIEMSKDQVQFGWHTHTHQSYSALSLPEIEADLRKTKDRLDELGIPVQPCLAYTFGAYNQQNDNKQLAMFELLKQHGIRLAFRVGNVVDKLPLRNKLVISRIHLSGFFPLWKFKVCLWGYIRVFNRLERMLK